MLPSKLDVLPSSAKEGEERQQLKISLNTEYIRTIPAIVKLVEFILLLLALSFVGSFKNGINTTGGLYSWGELDFYLFVTVISWLGTIAMFLLYFLNIINILKGKIPHLFILLALVHVIGAFFLLLCSSLVLDTCAKIRKIQLLLPKNNNKITICDLISSWTSTSCPALEFGGTLGLFCCFVVAFDSVMHMLKAASEYRVHVANRNEQQDQQQHNNEMSGVVMPSGRY